MDFDSSFFASVSADFLCGYIPEKSSDHFCKGPSPIGYQRFLIQLVLFYELQTMFPFELVCISIATFRSVASIFYTFLFNRSTTDITVPITIMIQPPQRILMYGNTSACMTIKSRLFDFFSCNV